MTFRIQTEGESFQQALSFLVSRAEANQSNIYNSNYRKKYNNLLRLSDHYQKIWRKREKLWLHNMFCN